MAAYIRREVPVDAVQLTEDTIVTLPDGSTVTIMAGVWVVTTRENPPTQTILDNTTFNMDYEPAPNG